MLFYSKKIFFTFLLLFSFFGIAKADTPLPLKNIPSTEENSVKKFWTQPIAFFSKVSYTKKLILFTTLSDLLTLAFCIPLAIAVGKRMIDNRSDLEELIYYSFEFPIQEAKTTYLLLGLASYLLPFFIRLFCYFFLVPSKQVAPPQTRQKIVRTFAITESITLVIPPLLGLAHAYTIDKVFKSGAYSKVYFEEIGLYLSAYVAALCGMLLRPMAYSIYLWLTKLSAKKAKRASP